MLRWMNAHVPPQGKFVSGGPIEAVNMLVQIARGHTVADVFARRAAADTPACAFTRYFRGSHLLSVIIRAANVDALRWFCWDMLPDNIDERGRPWDGTWDILGAALATLAPASRASRLTVREALTYL